MRKTFQLTSHAWCGQSLVPSTRFNIRSTMLHNFLAQDGQKLKFVIVSKRECIGKTIVAHLMRINEWKVIWMWATCLLYFIISCTPSRSLSVSKFINHAINYLAPDVKYNQTLFCFQSFLINNCFILKFR